MISKELEMAIVVRYREITPKEQANELIDFAQKLTEIIASHASEKKYSSASMITLMYLVSETFHDQAREKIEKNAVELYKIMLERDK